jgi:hypothetical protein
MTITVEMRCVALSSASFEIISLLSDLTT